MVKDLLIIIFVFFLSMRQVNRMVDAIADALLKKKEKMSYVSAFFHILEFFALHFILKYS
jgi:hypothetical protein